MRWFRLIMGVFIGIQAIELHQILPGIFSLFFIYQSLANVGCCGSQSCSTNIEDSKKTTNENVVFEEIK